MDEAEKIVRSAGISDDGDVAFDALVRGITSALDRARTEATAEALARAAEVARDPETEHDQVWEACDYPDALRNGIADAILALSPDPSYAARIRAEVLKSAARLVCGYCDGHFTRWEREARRGASGSGNWIHQHKGDITRTALCVATSIYNQLEYDRASKEPAK